MDTWDISQPEPEKATVKFFYVSEGRFLLMSILSLGIFEAYWSYKNWQYLKRRDNLDIMPFWRAVFAVVFIHALLDAIQKDTTLNAVEAPTFSGNTLATIWIILNLIGNITSRFDDQMVVTLGLIVAFPSFLCLLPIQKYINSVNEQQMGDVAYAEWSFGQVLCLLIGIPLLILLVVGLVIG